MWVEFSTEIISGFRLEQLNHDSVLEGFSCSVSEYNDYLTSSALRSQQDSIALTWLLRKRDSGDIAAYMSLVADAVKLSATEKELHNLDYPFKTIPAMKIAKLAVSNFFRQEYRGIGSFMIRMANHIARRCGSDYCAVRFLTVDADIEHDKNVLIFYEKNGFLHNAELHNKHRKTISMRLDLHGE
jgi:hypothetical protein